MDAFALLKLDHKKVALLLAKLEATTERAGKLRLDLYEQTHQELTVHMHIEEEILYPALKKHRQTRPMGFEGVEEHKLLKLLLGELGSLSVDSEEWTAKLKVLQETITHHVQEEEKEVFPKAQKIFSAEELNDLSALLEEEKLRFTADAFSVVHSF